MNKKKQKAVDALFAALQEANQNIRQGDSAIKQTEFFNLNDLRAIFKSFLDRQKVKEKDQLLARLRSVDDLRSMLSEFTDAQLKELLRLARKRGKAMEQLVLIELSRRDFWYYCQLRAPHFYKDSRTYLKTLCTTLQEFYASDDMVLVINLPPRHGKSFTISLFAQWTFGRNTGAKIMTGSYNERLSTGFSKTVRNGITEKKASDDVVVYSDIFPDTRIKQGDASMNLWSLEGAYASYLATSPTGTATGFGASLILIDDLIKNHYEAANELLLDDQWHWFTDTMLSRLEEGGKVILVMTRWASGDLAGRAVEHFREIGKPCRVLSMKALQDDGTMLCSEVLSEESYEIKVKTLSPEIANANYQQIPIDAKGRLYSSFKTYDSLDGIKDGFRGVYAYVDTADQGSDYLCVYIFADYNHEAYILDALFTKAGMEITEPETAKLLDRHKVNLVRIESNNGGRGFARAVIKHLQERLGNYSTTVKWFSQTKNKKARIISNAYWVTEHVYFPANWVHRWPELYKDLCKYQKEGKNKHDDAEDALSGVAETMYKLGA